MPAKPQDLPLLTINTIRTLHGRGPGRPTPATPARRWRWRRSPTASGSDFLRFDPDDPIWPNRDRFVLSAGHASMLLYSLLHLTGVKAVNPKYETARRARRSRSTTSSTSASSTASAPATPSTAGPPASRPPPARSARAWPTASAWRSPARWLAAHFNRPGFETVRLQRLRPLRRRLHDGGRSPARPPRSPATSKLSNLCWIYDNNHITIEGNTDLAFSEDVATRFIGYGWNVTARRRRQRPARCSTRAFRRSSKTTRPADADHRRQPHRLRRAEQAGHQRRPRRAARRGGDPARPSGSTAGRRTPSSSCPTASTSTSATGIGSARQGAARRLVRRGSSEYQAEYPELADQLYRMQHRQLPDGWDKDLPDVPRRSPRAWPAASSSGKVLNALAQERPLADRRLGRPGPVDQDAADVRGRRRLRGRQLRRPQPPLRHPRARDGRHPERHGAVQGPAVRLGLPDLQRLRPAADPPGRDHGDPGHLRLHPRLDRRRRGRPDPPADRAARRRCGRSRA